MFRSRFDSIDDDDRVKEDTRKEDLIEGNLESPAGSVSGSCRLKMRRGKRWVRRGVFIRIRREAPEKGGP